MNINNTNLANRAAGAIVGSFIGDALGVGPHWYYDLNELHRDYGEWITGYTAPKPHRYHAGILPGQGSQSAYINEALLELVVKRGAYVQEDFEKWLDEVLFQEINGAPMYGPGGWTSQSIREAYQKRVIERKPWSETGGQADSSELAERSVILAALYARSPAQVAAAVRETAQLTQTDTTVIALSVALAVTLALVIGGEPYDQHISRKLRGLVDAGELPFHHVTAPNSQPLSPGDPEKRDYSNLPSPDALSGPGAIARFAADLTIRVEPAWKASLVYGMNCAAYHLLPSAYYVAAFYPDDFENAVLHAVNGGGQNQSRALIVGALVGAQVGLDGIPRHFIDGLERGKRIVQLATELGEVAADAPGIRGQRNVKAGAG